MIPGIRNMASFFSLSLIIFSSLLCLNISAAIGDYEPQQVHIATGSSDEMIIVWNTFNDTKDSRVVFGKDKDNLDQTSTGTRTILVDGGPEKLSQFVHTVLLRNLDEQTVYCDIAYDLSTDNGRTGDAFMRRIEPLSSTVPYFTCPGNHENQYNFLHYKKRFRMPGDMNERMSYSFKMGPVRFIATNTESMFFPEYGLFRALNHFRWLEKELKDANLPENRAKQPWIIVLGHRPMYCSDKNTDDCSCLNSVIRKGVFTFLGWEDLFHKYGVDIAIWAHEHSYERMWPVYNGKGPTYTDHFDDDDIEEWSAFRNVSKGYLRLNAINSTHIHIEQVSVDHGANVIDQLMVIKDI